MSPHKSLLLFPFFFFGFFSAFAAEENSASVGTMPEPSNREDYLMKYASLGLITTQMRWEIPLKLNRPEIGSSHLENNPSSNSAGLQIRYSKIPRKGLGYDTSLAWLKSTNPREGEISQARGEINVANSYEISSQLAMYGLIGLNLEHLAGDHIEELVNPLGFGGQVGLGLGVKPRLHVEILYAVSRHPLSENLKNEFATNKQTLDPAESHSDHSGAILRAGYSF